MPGVRVGALLILVVCLLIPAAGAPASKKERELDDLRGRIESLQKELAASEESRGDAEDALRESERAISDANRRIAELAEHQQEADARLAKLQSEATRIKSEVDRQQVLLAKLLRQQYFHGEQDYLRLLLQGQDPNQAVRDLYYYGYISRERAAWLTALRQNLDRLEDTSRQAEAEAVDAARIREQQAQQRERLVREQEARKKVLAKVSREVARQRKEIGKLQRDEARLARLVERLSRLVTPKPQPESPAPGVKNLQVPESMPDARRFTHLKGQLRLPVRGELANRFGSPRIDGGTSWKGLFIRSPEGEPVRAIASGRVVYADWLRGFGNLMILDHGEGYMSLYGNNESLLKQVGEAVRGGDVVASVGNSGGNPDSGVYFELRHKGTPLDPLNWVSLK